ncbi:DUF1631 domain-containing protein [soil metagenome]
MASDTPVDANITRTVPPSMRKEILRSLIPIATCAANAQIDAFAIRLTDALFTFSDQCNDAKDANLTFNAANLLKKNVYAFYYLASAHVEEALKEELLGAEHLSPLKKRETFDDKLSLVSYQEMDNKVVLGNIGRPIEAANSELLTVLCRRLSVVLGRSELSMSQNPFRPEVFVSAIHDAWREFDPTSESHDLILPLLKPFVFIDLAPILEAVNTALVERGVVPEMGGYQIKKTNEEQTAAKKDKLSDSEITEQLTRLFGGMEAQGGVASGDVQNQLLQATAASNQLLGYLAGVQKSMFTQPQAGPGAVDMLSPALWQNIKAQAPQGALTRVDEKTIDLLTKIFDVVFNDKNIPAEIKGLIGYLQVPVLKAALTDKNFFFKDDHPARRLIDVISKSGLGLDQSKGQDDPLYQKMKHVVDRVQADSEAESTVFTDVVSDLESYINDDEAATTTAISTPITKALQQEKLGRASKSAKGQVSYRIGSGEVVAFLETFLEAKWVPVLTIAYSLEEEKPEVVENAVKTMDDLIWSVKPKITLDERKELISKLPTILASLNKWLNIIKWDDADRLQFFAELAECHASIVRAPLAISKERQLEIAVEVAKQAAERRLEKRAKALPEPVPDQADNDVTTLVRGMWLDYTVAAGDVKRVKLAWVSPMRSLYIFTTRGKEETFSVSAEELAQCFREKRAQTVLADGVIDRALSEALQSVGANDPKFHNLSAA